MKRVSKLKREFYNRPALKVARELLGKYIVRRMGGRKIIGKITEVEVYQGEKDKASHAYNGKRTQRNEVEYKEGGYIYIYLVYGMYWQLNIVTGRKEYPECVLIRAVEPISLSKVGSAKLNVLRNAANGPGKLCRWLKLDKSFYGEDLAKSKRIWLADGGEKIKPKDIKSGPRIGIDYAGPYWSKIKWRFWLKNNKFVSRLE